MDADAPDRIPSHAAATPSVEPDARRLVLRVLLLTGASAAFGVILNSTPIGASILAAVDRSFPGLEPGEAGYIAFIARTALFGCGTLSLVAAVVALERPQSLRAFFRLGPIDWPGVGLLFVCLAVVNAAEAIGLARFVYAPVGRLIASLGLPQASAVRPFVPDPHLAGVNLLLLVLVAWVEAPEEIFFRGYVQNHLERVLGSIGALFAAAVLWDAWHAFDPAGFPRRLLFGVALGLVFRLRGNATPVAVGHPLANRLLLGAAIAAPFLRNS